MNMGDQISPPPSGEDRCRVMKSNSLLCDVRSITGATEKGEPGSHLAQAVCEPSLSSGHEALTVV